jgi:cytochrome b561
MPASIRDIPERYNAAAIALHWLTAALILANLALGVSMVPLRISPTKLNLYIWHKSIGVTVFILTSLRLAWRATHRPPAPVPMPAWQLRATTVSHALMYVLLFLIPFSGWLYSSATGVQVVYLGLVPLPNLVPKDKAYADALRLLHVSLNLTLAVVLVVHTAAALKHHFVDRDRVLLRMLPWTRGVASP